MLKNVGLQGVRVPNNNRSLYTHLWPPCGARRVDQVTALVDRHGLQPPLELRAALPRAHLHQPLPRDDPVDGRLAGVLHDRLQMLELVPVRRPLKSYQLISRNKCPKHLKICFDYS